MACARSSGSCAISNGRSATDKLPPWAPLAARVSEGGRERPPLIKETLVCALALRAHGFAESNRGRRRHLIGSGGSQLLHEALLLVQQLLSECEGRLDDLLNRGHLWDGRL